MEIRSSFPFRISLQADRNRKLLPPLRKDEVLLAAVVESRSPQEAVLIIKGHKVVARTHIALKQGELLSLRVEEVVPYPVLKFLGTEGVGGSVRGIPAILSALEENLWRSAFEEIHFERGSVEQGLLLSQPMEELALDSSGRFKPDLLYLLIERSGLHWETKLKRALLAAKGRDPEPDHLIAGDLKGLLARHLGTERKGGSSLKRLFSAIEALQIFNGAGEQEQPKSLFIPVPLRWPDGFFSTGQLLIRLQPEGDERARRKGGRNRPFTMVFMLELSRLGPLRADFMLRGRELTGSFLVASRQVRALIEENIPSFVHRMEEMGYRVSHLSCCIKEREVVAKPLIKELIEEEGHFVSLVA